MAIQKITADVIATSAVTTDSLSDSSITAAKLHTTLDLTGKTVTVATASAGDNDTTVASTAFVSTAIANLADSAPSTLDTLNELAAALGDDANFSTTVTNSIALKAPLAGPTFTGDVDIDATDDLRLRFLRGSTFKGGIQVPTSTGDMISGAAVDDLAIRSQANMLFSSGGNTERMRIDSSGNVGIGTDSPDANLHISSAGGTELHLQEETAGQAAQIKFTNPQNSFNVGADANPQIFFINTEGNQGSGLCIDTSHNVGIGITPTEGKLHVKSDGAGEVELLTLENSTGTNGKTTLTFKTTSTDATKSAQIFAERVNASGHTDLAFRTYNGSTTEHMRIATNGNVGIGTNNPTDTYNYGRVLDIHGSTGAVTYLRDEDATSNFGYVAYDGGSTNRMVVGGGGTAYLRFISGGSECGRFDTSGNLTINSSGTIPTGVLLGRQFVVGSSTGSEVIAFREDTSVAVGDKVGAFLIGNSDTDGAEDHFVGMWGKVSSTNGSQDLHFAAGRSGYEGDVPHMTLDSSGKVGIGVSPSEALHIEYNTVSGGDNYIHMRKTDQGAGQGVFIGMPTASNNLRIMNHANNGITFHTQTSDTERMRIDPSGNVGIGATNPQAQFHIKNSGVAHMILEGDSDNTGDTGNRDNIIDMVHDNNINSGIRLSAKNYGSASAFEIQEITNGPSYQSLLYIDEDGKVGIGTDNPSTPLHVYNNTSGVIATISGPNNYNSETGISLAVDRAKISGVLNGSGGSPGASLRFYTQPDSGSLTERMRITSAGNVGINNPSPDAQLHIRPVNDSGDAVVIIEADVNNDVETDNPMLYFKQDGAAVIGRICYTNNNVFEIINQYNSSLIIGRNNSTDISINTSGVVSGDFNDTSDINLKENISNIDGGLSVVNQLRAVNFDWKSDEKQNGKAGFIAQEVEEILPNEIAENDSGKSINSTAILAHAIKAIQEQQTIIDDLKSRIETLEG